MESKRKFIKIQGRYYTILSLHGGYICLGHPTDVNNDIVKRGIIWEMSPFSYPSKFNIYVITYRFIRFFKPNIWMQSDFINMLRPTEQIKL